MSKHKKIRVYAVLKEILPEAIGRLLFIGCFLSFFISTISLKTYMELANKLKDMNAMHKGNNLERSVKLPWKNEGRKINKFFIH